MHRCLRSIISVKAVYQTFILPPGGSEFRALKRRGVSDENLYGCNVATIFEYSDRKYSCTKPPYSCCSIIFDITSVSIIPMNTVQLHLNMQL